MSKLSKFRSILIRISLKMVKNCHFLNSKIIYFERKLDVKIIEILVNFGANFTENGTKIDIF